MMGQLKKLKGVAVELKGCHILYGNAYNIASMHPSDMIERKDSEHNCKRGRKKCSKQ